MNYMGTDKKAELHLHSAFISSRREFLIRSSALGAGLAVFASLKAGKLPLEKFTFTKPGDMKLSFVLNGKNKTVEVDPRTSLLDLLRENLKLTGTKKGCDRGQCGACTVLVDGRRVNSCLTLAAMCEGAKVTSIEGLGSVDNLHPLQQAFLKHDAFQCGYCTPGQICSAAGLLSEGRAKTDQEIRENMSGNICRCGAYQNILDAIKEVQLAK
jgi:xanthine dehydrogenase YagT iron-sulfur-binding subunit